MKLARIGTSGTEKPALIDADGNARDLSGVIEDIDGRVLSTQGLNDIRRIEPTSLPVVPPPFRYGPCVGNSSQFICVGLNYADHAREAGAQVPEEPILFMKSPSAICGPNDDVIIPRDAHKVDWEVELGVIIGRPCSYVDIAEASDYIAGFCVINDISERAFQMEGTGQWVKGKSADTFGPLGPWLVTPDEIEDVQRLDLWLTVNDEVMQKSNTDQMIFDVAHLVSTISQYMSLKPGDIISTGTPFGVGLGLSPPRYLQPGDKMMLGIEHLGVQTQQVVSWSPKQVPG